MRDYCPLLPKMQQTINQTKNNVLNWNYKYKQNQNLIRSYNAFLIEVKELEPRLQLINEIARMSLQNKTIEQMTVEDYKQDCSDYTIQKNSKLQ